ncbi:hypothetical protein [Candidatus Chlorohelix allophototropha]
MSDNHQRYSAIKAGLLQFFEKAHSDKVSFLMVVSSPTAPL